MIPESIKKFADVFKKLPGIGPRQAIRLAYYLAENDRATLADLKDAVELVASLKPCKQCFYVHNDKGDLCSICGNPSRVKSVIAIVEKATDLMSLEKTKKYSGRYLVLGDLGKSGVLEMEPK